MMTPKRNWYAKGVDSVFVRTHAAARAHGARAEEPTSSPALESDEGHDVITLWPGVAPGSENWTQKEVRYNNTWDHKKMVPNVTRPTLTVYRADPAKASGAAVIIAPGGGFRFLSWQNEGTAVAEWLAVRGVSAFVLKYRLMDTGDSLEAFETKINSGPRTKPAGMDIAELATADGRQAMKVIRQRCTDWKIAPDRIGIIGFSAGGVVAMGVVNQHDADTHPDFAAPVYGTGPESALPKDAPPLFILCASDDKGTLGGTMRVFSKWKAAGLSAELHIYSKGGHGFGMSQRGLPIDHWIDRFGDWLTVQGLMKP